METYAGTVTLMLTFFVLLFAASSVNAAKWQRLVAALSAGIAKRPVSEDRQAAARPADGASLPDKILLSSSPGAPKRAPPETVDRVREFDDLYVYLRRYVDKNRLQDSVELLKGDNYTFLSFRSSIFFAADSAELQPQGRKILDVLCGAMAGISDQIGEIRFYGHTAKASGITTADQQAFDRSLSEARAQNCLLYVQRKGVVSGSRMVSEGYGEYRPIVPDDGTEKTRSKNRRVEVYLSKTGFTDDVLQKVYGELNASSGTQDSG